MPLEAPIRYGSIATGTVGFVLLQLGYAIGRVSILAPLSGAVSTLA